MWIGYNPPFVTPGNILPLQVDERLIKNDLLQLLLTSPGERVMRPDFGTKIRRFTFEPLTPADIMSLKQNILDAIAKYEQRVKVTDVKITTDEDRHLVSISVLCKLTIDPNTSLRVDLEL